MRILFINLRLDLGFYFSLFMYMYINPKEIVNREQAEKLKKLGFNSPTMCYYVKDQKEAMCLMDSDKHIHIITTASPNDEIYRAPLITTAIEWLERKLGKISIILPMGDNLFSPVIVDSDKLIDILSVVDEANIICSFEEAKTIAIDQLLSSAPPITFKAK